MERWCTSVDGYSSILHRLPFWSSLIECSGLCQSSPECRAGLHYDKSTSTCSTYSDAIFVQDEESFDAKSILASTWMKGGWYIYTYSYYYIHNAHSKIIPTTKHFSCPSLSDGWWSRKHGRPCTYHRATSNKLPVGSTSHLVYISSWNVFWGCECNILSVHIYI